MNAACSTCLGSFTSISDISTTPCGHVFHTDCIEKWLQNGSNSCSQCRKDFQRREITKLFFSTSQSENDLILELEEVNSEAEKRSLKFQKQNSELRKEKSDVHKENSELRGENLKLSRHLRDLRLNSETKERASNKIIGDLRQEIIQLKSEGGNKKKRRGTKGRTHTFHQKNNHQKIGPLTNKHISLKR